LVADNHLLVAPCEGHQAHEVRHDAAGHEQRGFLADALGGGFLQALYRRVVAQHIVADLRFRHRAAHRGRRLRDGVRTQVNQPVRFAHHSTPL
jgi:hypothetical protein